MAEETKTYPSAATDPAIRAKLVQLGWIDGAGESATWRQWQKVRRVDYWLEMKPGKNGGRRQIKS